MTISVYAQNARLRKRVAALRKRLEEEMKKSAELETQLFPTFKESADKFIDMMKKTGKGAT